MTDLEFAIVTHIEHYYYMKYIQSTYMMPRPYLMLHEAIKNKWETVDKA